MGTGSCIVALDCWPLPSGRSGTEAMTPARPHQTDLPNGHGPATLSRGESGAGHAGHFSFYTVGHSTWSVAELADLLRQAWADLVADVRTIPRSRANPQCNADVLPAALTAFQIGYRHLRKLAMLAFAMMAVLRHKAAAMAPPQKSAAAMWCRGWPDGPSRRSAEWPAA